VVFVIRRDIDQAFRSAVGSRYGSAVQVEYAFQELTDLPQGFSLPPQRKKPWGTAHAIMAATEAVDEPFAAINADDFYGPKSYDALFGFLRQVRADSREYAMVGFTLRETLSDHGSVARGVCEVDSDGFLEEVVERTRIERSGRAAKAIATDGTTLSLTGDERVSLNMWGFTPALFEQLQSAWVAFLSGIKDPDKEEFFIPSVIHGLIVSHRATVRVLPTDERWFGVTYPDDKASTQAGILELVKAGAYPKKLFG
jgi:hypothetical protein